MFRRSCPRGVAVTRAVRELPPGHAAVPRVGRTRRLPEVLVDVRRPDGSQEWLHSPSTVVEEVFRAGETYPLADFVELTGPRGPRPATGCGPASGSSAEAPAVARSGWSPSAAERPARRGIHDRCGPGRTGPRTALAAGTARRRSTSRGSRRWPPGSPTSRRAPGVSRRRWAVVPAARSRRARSNSTSRASGAACVRSAAGWPPLPCAARTPGALSRPTRGWHRRGWVGRRSCRARCGCLLGDAGTTRR
jgi:hypothetical protein